MRLAAQVKAAARDVRQEMSAAHRQHGESIPPLKLYKLYLTCERNPGVAADAAMMWPRPLWVEQVLGPYPASLELANPEDSASISEWGSSDVGT